MTTKANGVNQGKKARQTQKISAEKKKRKKEKK